MTLGTSLAADLEDIADDFEANIGGSDYTADTIANAAEAWAAAIQVYASGVVPASTTVAAAAITLQAVLASAFANTVAATTAAAMETAFTTFATTVGTGMAPAFVATPPPGSVGFASLFSAPYPTTHAAAATAMASAIDTWMRTGTATPSGGGSPVPWS